MRLVIKVILLFLFLVFFVQPKQTYAATNFTTDYHVTYTIDKSGVTQALLHIVLTNTSSQFYASSYKMQIGFDDITNVKATDADGPLQPQITKADDGYAINVTFNHKAVGLGSKQDFTLTFDTTKLARHYGKIWEIDIPGIANPNDFTNFVIELKVPPSFGQASYIKPSQSDKALVFTKETLGKSGISVAFGDKQTYKYNLTYHLRNPNLYPITTEIALPPNTNYQNVYINNITPKPNNVTQDKDGNWIAQFKLMSVQKMDVHVDGTTDVSLTPKPITLSAEERKAYTQEAKYWETSSDKIRELADELRTPDAIYAYVVNTLKYDFKRVTQEKPRLGALGAFKNPSSAVCREYTDLFIAIARAAGIPAREVDGYAYTDNARQKPLSQEKDVLHVWPEYYDSQRGTWVMVDPTWGSTTGGVDYFNVNDFSHFAFVVKGYSSEYPIPAGGYKFTDDAVSKDVQVEFTTDDPEVVSRVKTESTVPALAIAGLPISGNITVKNTGSTYFQQQILYVNSKTFLPDDQAIVIKGIPPFGKTVVPVTFQPTSFLTNTTGDYTILVAGNSQVHSITSALFYLTPTGGGIILGLFAFIILIIAIKSRSLHVSRRK